MARLLRVQRPAHLGDHLGRAWPGRLVDDQPARDIAALACVPCAPRTRPASPAGTTTSTWAGPSRSQPPSERPRIGPIDRPPSYRPSRARRARHRAVEIERVRRLQPVAEQPGEWWKVTGAVGDRETGGAAIGETPTPLRIWRRVDGAGTADATCRRSPASARTGWRSGRPADAAKPAALDHRETARPMQKTPFGSSPKFPGPARVTSRAWRPLST